MKRNESGLQIDSESDNGDPGISFGNVEGDCKIQEVRTTSKGFEKKIRLTSGEEQKDGHEGERREEKETTSKSIDGPDGS